MAKKTWLYSDYKPQVKNRLSGEDLYYKKLKKSIDDAEEDRVLYRARKRVEKAQSARQVPQLSVSPQKEKMLKSAESLENVFQEMTRNPVIFENDFKEFKTKLSKGIETLPLGNAMQMAVMKARIVNSVSMYDLKNQIASIIKSLKQLPAPSSNYTNLMPRERS